MYKSLGTNIYKSNIHESKFEIQANSQIGKILKNVMNY